jgi:hypothetical protein
MEDRIMKLLLTIFIGTLLVGCGSECEENCSKQVVFPEYEEDEDEETEPSPEPNQKPGIDTPSPSGEDSEVTYDTRNMWLDPVTNSYWIAGPALDEYAGGYPCGIEGYWWMPYTSELRAAGLRGLTPWAEAKGASPVALISDGYSACSVRDCSEVDTLSVYCVLREEYHEYQDVPWIVGSAEHLCDTPDLAKEDYCE